MEDEDKFCCRPVYSMNMDPVMGMVTGSDPSRDGNGR
jgi:hypothetical protein